MFRSLILAGALITAPAVFSSTAYCSAPHVNQHLLLFSKSRVVRFDIRNDRPEPIELKIGKDVISVQSKQTIHASAPEGTQIVANAAFGTTKQGDVITTVSRQLSGNALSIR